MSVINSKQFAQKTALALAIAAPGAMQSYAQESAPRTLVLEEIVITAQRDQRIRPLPEGGSYLGFIFARAERPDQVESALRTAHGRLRFEIAAPIPLV